MKKTAARDAWTRDRAERCARIADIVTAKEAAMPLQLDDYCRRWTTRRLAATAGLLLLAGRRDRRGSAAAAPGVRRRGAAASSPRRSPSAACASRSRCGRIPKQPGRWMLNFGARRLRASRLAGQGRDSGVRRRDGRPLRPGDRERAARRADSRWSWRSSCKRQLERGLTRPRSPGVWARARPTSAMSAP